MRQERNPPRALHARLTSISVVLASGILAASILTAGSANASATLIGASGNVLVNNGEPVLADLRTLVKQVRSEIKARYHIHLDVEPTQVGGSLI